MQHTERKVGEKKANYEPGASKLFFPNDKRLRWWLVAPAEAEAAEASEEIPEKLLVLQAP